MDQPDVGMVLLLLKYHSEQVFLSICNSVHNVNVQIVDLLMHTDLSPTQVPKSGGRGEKAACQL